jgi:hypothetical protein
MRSGNAARSFVLMILSSLTGLACSSVDADALAAPPPHVPWAELAVDTIDPDDNEYASTPSFIAWGGHDGAAQTKNRSVCATFLTLLLARSYGLTGADFAAWMGSASPSAGVYYEAVAGENGFHAVATAPAIEVGDILAIEYPGGSSSSSGHVMVVTGAPLLRAPTAPVIQGTSQYEVTIIDSSSSPHGSSDTRMLAGSAFDTGIGEGTFRLYTDSSGAIVGHTWSTESGSTYYNQADRPLAAGRLIQMEAATPAP